MFVKCLGFRGSRMNKQAANAENSTRLCDSILEQRNFRSRRHAAMRAASSSSLSSCSRPMYLGEK